MNNDFEIPSFDYNEFENEVNSGDIWGLEYLEKTLIRDYKDRLNDSIQDKYCWYDYIISLFYAVKELNSCNDIYETSNVENNFNYDLYFQTRDLLFEELGFDLNKLFD